MNKPANLPRHELTITRLFDAPCDLVFKVWTTPEHIPNWWGPRGYTTLSCNVDLRVGGSWRVTSRHDDGSTTAETGTFLDVEKPSRLVMTHAWENQTAAETIVTITFAEEGSKTRMTFHQASFASIDTRDGHVGGWNESFDMLAEHLAQSVS